MARLTEMARKTIYNVKKKIVYNNTIERKKGSDKNLSLMQMPSKTTLIRFSEVTAHGSHAHQRFQGRQSVPLVPGKFTQRYCCLSARLGPHSHCKNDEDLLS
uniref:Uncharacterized protein n=1 Tax=Lepeophtheirus salmonis TaxID=72036 RepID=A0A0K2T1Z5_LEPSM